jgi:chemotaxis protein CheX
MTIGKSSEAAMLMQLPHTLDLAGAGPLLAELRAARGDAIEIDASQVERFGGLCLQVLLAAKASWAEAGKTFVIVNPSEAFRAAAATMGASAYLIEGDAL